MKYRLNPRVILERGCPRCGRKIFHGPLSMYDECPGCGLDFDRGQPGYFTGAMYVSYALGIPLIALVTLIEYLVVRDWSIFRLVLFAWVLTLPLFPWIWQYSRVIWIHFDRWVDPETDNREKKSPY
jgi:uncharacterized protein (DUF983 family)